MKIFSLSLSLEVDVSNDSPSSPLLTITKTRAAFANSSMMWGYGRASSIGQRTKGRILAKRGTIKVVIFSFLIL